MRLDVKSNFRGFLADQARRDAHRASIIRKGLRRHGNRYNRLVVTRMLSNRPGLRRRTGYAARSWNRSVRARGETTTLSVYTFAPYLRFHADDYVPKGQPRHNPIRLRTSALWSWFNRDDELKRSFGIDPVIDA